MKKILSIVIFCLFCSINSFCLTEKEVWKQVESKNTVEGYKDFIQMYPNGKYSDEAKQKLIEYKNLEAVRKSIEWVDIPADTFIMGSPESERKLILTSEPQHRVTLSAFKMSKYEVTFAQYDLYCEAKGIKKTKDRGWGRENMPVISMSWSGAKAFADWEGCQLPTEAQWEYACRAGTTTPFNTGDDLSASKANYETRIPYNKGEKVKPVGKTMPVGSYPPNAWGLYDMHGNVSEWCREWPYSYSTNTQINPIGPEIWPVDPKFGPPSNHIRRGGSFVDGAKICRSACRVDLALENFYTNGIRLVYNK